MRLDDAEDLVVAYGFASVVDVDDAGVERGLSAVGVDDVGEVEHDAWARVFIGSFLGEEDGCVDPGAGGDDEFAGIAGDVFATFAERVGDNAFDGVSGAGAVAVDGIGEADTKGFARGEVGALGFGYAGGDGAGHLAVGHVEEVEEGGEEAASRTVFDQQGLDLEIG